MVWIMTYEANGVNCGTLDALRELEKLGLFTIVEVKNYTINEYWDDIECYDVYNEDFVIRIAEKKNPINACGYNFVHQMICGLIDYVGVEFVEN